MVRLKRALSSTAGMMNSWPSTNGLSNFQIDSVVSNNDKHSSKVLSIAEKCSSIEKPPVPHLKCKVIATIGGEMSKTVDDLCMFLESGVTVARYDFSHSTSSHEEFQEVMKNLTRAQKITVSFRASSSVASIVVNVSSNRLCKCYYHYYQRACFVAAYVLTTKNISRIISLFNKYRQT